MLDAVIVSLGSRFNSECVAVIEGISSVIRPKCDYSYETAIRQLGLCDVAKIDSDRCLAEAKQLRNLRPDLFCMKDGVTNLRQITATMIEMKYSVVYKSFYNLLVYLMTLPVASASCEPAHRKVDLVKSAVRASMTSDRLEDLVIISSEKNVVDNVEIHAVVSRFANVERGLPL